MFKAERFSAARVGAAVQGRGREVRGPGGRAPRRLPHVRLQPHRVVGREDGAEAGHRRRALARGAGRGPRVRPLLPPRRALVVLRRRHGVRLGREGPALRRLLRPGPPAEEGRGQERAAHEGVPRRLARAHRRARRQVPPAARLVRLVDRAAGLRAVPAALRGLLLQPRRRVAEGRRDQLQERVLPREGRGVRRRARPAARASGPSSGRRTPRSRRTPGATSRSRTTRRPARSSATSSTSSARTAPCCSTSARARTARSPSRSRRSCARSAGG